VLEVPEIATICNAKSFVTSGFESVYFGEDLRNGLVFAKQKICETNRIAVCIDHKAGVDAHETEAAG
jgi:hypothetical protein